MLIAAAWRRRHDDDGIGLVELLVVMLLLTVVGAMVLSTVIGGLQTTRKADARVTALTDLQKAVERIGRETRVADPLLVASASDFQGQIYRNGARLRYRYWLSGTDLMERRDQFSAGTWSVGPAQVFVRDVVESNVFTYLDATGADITGQVATGAASVNDVARVSVRLRRGLREQSPIEVQTLVMLRNAEY
jgi:type II secretory pathway pseudopilin PulG